MVHLMTNIAEYAIIIDDNKFLMVQWGQQYDNTWHFPGGRLDENDREIEGLRREVKEEIGVEIIDIKPVFSKFVTKAECQYAKKDYQMYTLFYTARIKPGQEIKLDEVEHHNYKWFTRKDLENIEFYMDFYKEMLEEIF
ncbi:NUDIX hydrolase [Candidatus Woesearchaeota archaeon]|nr:NUDIX hydrolase [Candidatus Woesearchaeota archaeon]